VDSEANRVRCSNRRWPARFVWLLLEPAQLLQQLGAQISGITWFGDRGGFALGTPSLGAPCWPSRGWFGCFVLARARVGLGVLFGSPLALSMLWQRRKRLGTIARVVATVALLRASYQTSAVLDTNAWSTVASSRGAGSSVDSSPVMPSAPMAEP